VSTSSLTGGTYTWSVQAVQVVPANYALGEKKSEKNEKKIFFSKKKTKE